MILCLTFISCASMGDGSVTEKRQAILSMKDKTLTQLFKQHPQSKQQINSASGYAVFSNANINLLFMSTGTGYGVVKNMVSKQQTFMNMAEGGLGFGLGIKDYRLVMVFHSQTSIDNFINSGWTFGGNADASAKSGDKGASISGETYYGDVSVYTFTTSGIALQATIKGTKFWQDDTLNAK
jgi:lipid-binding SYLF domain-containing protein